MRRDGSRFFARVVLTALRDADGHLVGVGKVTSDVTEAMTQAEHDLRALRESQEAFRLLVESVRDHAIFMLDVDGRVATWNAGAERLEGYTAAEIIGRHFSTFYTSEDIAAGKPASELERATRDGPGRGAPRSTRGRGRRAAEGLEIVACCSAPLMRTRSRDASWRTGRDRDVQ